MAKFSAVRNNPDSPAEVIDGQFLVDKKWGTISFDMPDDSGDVIRKEAPYLTGVKYKIDPNMWIPYGDKYIIELEESILEVPLLYNSGYPFQGAIITDGEGIYTGVSVNGYPSLVSDYPRASGTALVLVGDLPLAGDFGQGMQGLHLNNLLFLYHFEEEGHQFDDATGNTGMSVVSDSGTGDVSTSSASVHPRYGSSCLEKYKGEHLEITSKSVSSEEASIGQVLPVVNGFTLEWWQYDVDDNGCGGIVVEEDSEYFQFSMEMPPINAKSPLYRPAEWKHFAAVMAPNESTIKWYVDGKLFGFSELELAEDSSGAGFFNTKFYGAQGADGESKSCFIDGLALFNYPKYNGPFEPSLVPYKGAKEVGVILANSEYSIDVSTGTQTVSVPISLSSAFTSASDTIVAGDSSKVTCRLAESVDGVTIDSFDGSSLTVTIDAGVCEDIKVLVSYPGSLSEIFTIHMINNTGYSQDILYTNIAGAGKVTYYLQDPAAEGGDRIWVCSPTTGKIIVDGGYLNPNVSGVYTAVDEDSSYGNRQWSASEIAYVGQDLSKGRKTISIDGSVGVVEFAVIPYSRFVIDGEISTINITKVVNSDLESDIQFTTGSASVAVNIPSSVGVAGELNFLPSRSYIMSFRNNIVVAIEYTPGVTL